MANNRIAKELVVIGAGLAGCEAAYQAAERGFRVKLFEMRPAVQTGAHTSGNLAELVCSNSLGSDLPERASGILKRELRRLGSLLMRCADEAAVPAGGALAVDREAFSANVSERIEHHPNIELIRQEVVEIPQVPTIIASGPLTSQSLSQDIQRLTGQDHLYFFDAIAPIVTNESINMEVAYRASRYGRGEQEAGDYINCPLTRQEYEVFVETLASADRIELKDFEKEIESGVKAGFAHFFEGCLPVEILAQRSRQALAFGPMRPVGLVDPRSVRRPYAVVQLRQDNLAGTLYNLVGFQTNLREAEQKRVFRMIPGLEQAEFTRYGQMHRNTFIFSPAHLKPTLQFVKRDDLFFAGQITGVEGYVGNIATGLVAGMNAARVLIGNEPAVFPVETMIGALCHYVTHASGADFQPMKANLGILPPLEESVIRDNRGKRQRGQAYADRSKTFLESYLMRIDIA
jgi:methylenetetrahydrofolate--tRNA-(uracil-5-)-methyltransferase